MFVFDDRQKLLLSQLDLSGPGLEIGPSYSPVAPKKSGLNIETADYLNREDLCDKYRDATGVDISNIEDVDYILSGSSLSEKINKSKYYKYIIASHVIEHVPDLVRFLQECQSLLTSDGVLALAIPDKRACFDFFQSISTTGLVLDAYERCDVRPSAGCAYDNEAFRTTLDNKIAWPIKEKGSLFIPDSTEKAEFVYRIVSSTNSYHDFHVWRFTPSSFRIIISDLKNLNLIDLNELCFLPT
jgi:hypothetical protein